MNQYAQKFRPKPLRSQRLLLEILCLFLCVATSARAAVDWSTKHQPRVGANLVNNPEFNGAGDWFLSGATYDSGVSRSAGSGSMRLFTQGEKFESFFPKQVVVTPGETYTFSAYSRANTTNGFPSPIIRMNYNYRSSTGLFLGNSTSSNTRYGNSKTGEWEEMSAIIQVPDQIGGTPVERIELEFFNSDQIAGVDREFWIDDVYVGLGRGFEQPPTPKTAFDGKQTRVDELGNMEVLKNGTTWEPFFPLAMYGDGGRPDWSDYSNQGFNMEMRASVTNTVQKAALAGMMSGIDISAFMGDGFNHYNDVALIQSRIADFKAQGVMDDIALFYWDNETGADEWDVPVAITDAIKADDVDGNGDRLHPIYTLNGQNGVARRHQSDQAHLSDITGVYIGGDNGNPKGRTNNFRVLDNNENQRQPVTFAQINRGVGNEMRPRLFGAIAHGARGLGFWRDYYNHATNAAVEDLPWWDDFPNIASEIDQMMDAGLIQVPHWTDWSIDSNADYLIDFGTRDLNGEGYLIAVNYDDTSSVVTFTLDSLGYTPVEVRDFFTDAVVATLVGNQFDVTLGANSSGVFRLVAPQQGLAGDYNDDGTVDAADYTVWLDSFGAPAGTLLNDTDGGVIGQAQYATWKANFGNTGNGSGSTSSHAIPEPSTYLLMLVGVLGWGGIVRRMSCTTVSPAVDAARGGVASQQMFAQFDHQARSNQSAWRQR